MNWNLLGIEPTKDKKIITTAYRTKLAHTNPEDKPEEFKALRSAYEEALRLAEEIDEEPVRDESPVGKWMEQIRILYDDFPSRIRPEKWEELLNDDVCIGLDTRPLAEEALLNFFMQYFYIPQPVWQTLDNTFNWMQRREELYESYPRDFVDYAVINGIRYPGNLPYELFIPGTNGTDCDEYRRLYYQANQSSKEEMGSLLEQMDELTESHPYGELLRYYLLIENGDTDKGLKGYKELAELYPQDVKLNLDFAFQCMNINDWSEGEKYARIVLSIAPENPSAKQILATCLANQGQYEDAKKMIFNLMDDAGGDQRRIFELRNIIQEWNEKLIQILESQLDTEPENVKARIELAWCYLQNDRENDAFELCRSIDPEYEDKYDYNNLLSKVTYSIGDYDTALSYLKKTVEILKMMEPDGTEETDSRIKTLPEKLQMTGSCLINLGRNDEAEDYYEQALALAPLNPEVLTQMGRLLCYIGNYNRAAEIFKTLIDVLPNAYHAYYLLSQTLFDLGRDREAFENVNRALELQGGDLGVYLLKIRILLRNGAWEGVRDTIDFLRQHGISDEINSVWYEAQLLEYGEGNKEQALNLYRILASRIENGEILEEASKLYYHLLCLEAEHLDAGKSEDRAIMLEIAEKGLKHNENDFPCLDYKAWLLKRDGQRDEALKIYHRLEEVPRRSMNVEQELAELYYQDLGHDAEKALHYYKLLIEHEEQPVYLFYAGTCCRYLDLYDEAKQYFLKLQELEPDGIDGYNGMSYLYDAMKCYEDSLVQIDKIIELVKERTNNQSNYYYHKVRILRRLNRPDEAMAVIDEIESRYGNADVYQEKFEICCQFGLWDKAAEILKEWKKSGNKKNRLKAAEIDFELYTGRIDKARGAFKKSSGQLNDGDIERLSLLIAELDGDEKAQMSILEKKINNKNDKTHELMNMAQSKWWSGQYDKAREYAAEALAKLDEIIPGEKRYAALYRGRRVMVLAILGRFDEAIAEVEEVYKLPLCENCNYCSCKDADIFMADIEEVRGNYEKAFELHSKGADRWPDDLDFVSGMRRIKRKELGL